MTYYLIPIIALLILATIAFFFFLARKRSFQSSEEAIRAKIKKVLKTEDQKAEMIIDDYVNRLRERIPGKNMDWYLEKTLYDFSRDR